MHLSAYLQERVAGYVRGTNLPAPPTTITAALSTTDPLDDGSGISEPVGNGYARQTVTFGAPTSTVGNGSSIFNDGTVTFGPVTGADWPHINYIALFDEGGNLLFRGEINVPRRPPVQDRITFGVGAIQLQLSKFFSHHLGQIILGWLRGTAAPAAPTSLLLALSSTNPTDSGSAMDEPDIGDGYGRQAITFDAPVTEPNGTTITSEGPYMFGPASKDWVPITHGVVLTGAGKPLFIGPLAAMKPVTEGNLFVVPSGAISLRIT